MKAVSAFALAGLLLFPSMPLAQMAETPRQLEHGKLFQNYGIKGHKLTEGEGQGGLAVHEDVPLVSTLPSRLAFFTMIACQSDAVIVGKVVSQTAVLSQDESFIFTDAEVFATEVIKDNPLSKLPLTRSVTVTRPGGVLLMPNGRKLQVALNHFRDFSNSGQYLLFLRFLPTTQDYQALWDRSFELRGSEIFNSTPLTLWDGQQAHGREAVDAAAALVDARVAAASSCR